MCPMCLCGEVGSPKSENRSWDEWMVEAEVKINIKNGEQKTDNRQPITDNR
jgi:hypothetical protein